MGDKAEEIKAMYFVRINSETWYGCNHDDVDGIGKRLYSAWRHDVTYGELHAFVDFHGTYIFGYLPKAVVWTPPSK